MFFNMPVLTFKNKKSESGRICITFCDSRSVWYAVAKRAWLVCLVIKNETFIGIDDMGIAIFVVAFIRPAIGKVHMSVQKVSWVIFFHELDKRFEPLVRQVPAVI